VVSKLAVLPHRPGSELYSSSYVKIMGKRFAAGRPSNNPLGHYFDALYLTGYYYTFIGIAQIIIAMLLLMPNKLQRCYEERSLHDAADM
jgi:hypothetical protein